MQKRALSFILFFLICRAAHCIEMGNVYALGMAGAYTACSGDVGALSYNPAGLALIKGAEAGINFGRDYQSYQDSFLSGIIFSYPVSFFGKTPVVGQWQDTQGKNGSIQQLGVGTGRLLTVYGYSGRAGGGIRMYSDNINKKTFWVMDAGVQTDEVYDNLSCGISLRNLFSADKSLAGTIPSAGAIYSSVYGNISCDYKWEKDVPYAALGWEYKLKKDLLIARLGVLNSVQPYITAGLSSHMWPMGFDTSFAWPAGHSYDTGFFQLALRYRFGDNAFYEVCLKEAEEKVSLLEERLRIMEDEQKNMTGYIESLKGEVDEAKRQSMRQAPLRRNESKPKEKPVIFPVNHSVKSGETLRSLAEKYYGDPNKWQKIYDNNPDKVDRGQLKPGSEILIPKP